nr:protein FORGETTER 1 isoform X2 [Tanacetum cinerariifolium]
MMSYIVLHYDVSFIFYGMFKIFRSAVGEVVREMSINELQDEYRKTLSLEKAQGGWVSFGKFRSKQFYKACGGPCSFIKLVGVLVQVFIAYGVNKVIRWPLDPGNPLSLPQPHFRSGEKIREYSPTYPI